MGLERIVKIDLRLVAIAPKGSLGPLGVCKDHDEVINPDQRAVYLGTGRGRHCDRNRRNIDRRWTATPASRHDPRLLKLPLIGELTRVTFEIACRRVAGSTG